MRRRLWNWGSSCWRSRRLPKVCGAISFATEVHGCEFRDWQSILFLLRIPVARECVYCRNCASVKKSDSTYAIGRHFPCFRSFCCCPSLLFFKNYPVIYSPKAQKGMHIGGAFSGRFVYIYIQKLMPSLRSRLDLRQYPFLKASSTLREGHPSSDKPFELAATSRSFHWPR